MLNQEKENKWRDRTMRLLLYPEDITHREALERIKASYDYACILHDKDIEDEETGEVKKAHWHIVLRFKNQKWNTAVAKDLGITTNYIRECDNFDNALLYLIHYNDDDKYKYDINEVQGNLKSRLKDKINSVSKSEGEKVSELIEYIENANQYISVKDFAKYCAVNGYWSEFRRSGAIFLKILEECNKNYC